MHFYKRKFNTPEYRKRYTGIYGSWYAMKQRCGNPNNHAYRNYGGRGIKVCDKWLSFSGFSEDMSSSYKKGLTLELIDVNGNYEVDNCKWIPKKEQLYNMRKTIWIEHNGEKKTLMHWANELGLKYHTLLFRYLRGWSVERLLNPGLERPWKLVQ